MPPHRLHLGRLQLDAAAVPDVVHVSLELDWIGLRETPWAPSGAPSPQARWHEHVAAARRSASPQTPVMQPREESMDTGRGTLRLLCHHPSDDPATIRWSGLLALPDVGLWLEVNGDPSHEASMRQGMIDVARGYRSDAGRAARPPDGFHGLYGVFTARTGRMESVEAAFEDPTGTVELSIESRIVVAPGPRDLRDLDEIRADLAAAGMSSRLALVREGRRVVGGLDGIERVVDSRSGAVSQLICEWAFPGQAGAPDRPLVELRLAFAEVDAQAAAIADWDAVLDSVEVGTAG